MAHWFDASKYQKYIVKMGGGKPYLMVVGQIKSAHDAGVLLGSETFVEYTEKHVRVRVRIKVLNKHLDNFDSLPEDAKIGYYDGVAESPLTGGKSAEGVFPTEVCETSALGRAMAKFGVNLDSMATAEEMEQVATKKNTGYDKKPDFDDEVRSTLRSQGWNTKGKVEAASQERFSKPFDELDDADLRGWVAELKKKPVVPF